MTLRRNPPSPPRRLWIRLVLLTCFAAVAALPAFADAPPKAEPPELPPALEKVVPESVEDLRAIQEQVKKVLERVLPATVGVRVGAGQGSGVIISEDGYVLTAGHVVAEKKSKGEQKDVPDKSRDVIIILPDGKRLNGKTLGANRAIDSGLIKITDKGKWPFAEMGNSKDIKRGQWCITIGHPGGYRAGRTPVVRVGRVLDQSDTFLRTTCTLVGGDSGGPLFDLQGKVIGIHSRIGDPITANIHVPVDTFRETWDRLAQGEKWGGRIGSKGGDQPFLGVEGNRDAKECRLVRIVPGSAAEKAGLQENDVVTRFGEMKIDSYDELVSQIARKKPGDRVTLEVQRGDESVSVPVVIGKRDN